MERIDAIQYIAAERSAVFARLAEHEEYTRFPYVTVAKLLTPGAQERNGVGACRLIRVPPIELVETITVFEPPSVIGYQVVDIGIRVRGVQLPLPLLHHGGRIELTRSGPGTTVHWSSEFETTIGIAAIGPPVERVVRDAFAHIFRRALATLREDAESGAPTPSPKWTKPTNKMARPAPE